MPMIRAMRLLNAIEAGTTSGSQLETLLSSDPGRAAEFSVLCGIRAQVRRMLSAPTTMAAIFGSSKAAGVFAANPTSMLLAAQDATHGPTMVGSVAAKMAIFNSDNALSALASSPAALSLFRTSSQYVVRSIPNAGASVMSPAPVAAGSYILLGASSTNASAVQTMTVSTLREGAVMSNVITPDGTVNTGTTALYYPRAIPLVAPFFGTQAAARAWYVGMLRCDV